MRRSWEGFAKSPAVQELIASGGDLLVVFEVVAFSIAAEVPAFNLVNHQRMIIRNRATLHFAELNQRRLERLAISEVLTILVELVVPLVAGALVVDPPIAPGLLVAAVHLVVVGLEPRLGGVARHKAIVENHRAGGVLLVHKPQDTQRVRILEVGANLILQCVLDERWMAAKSSHHGRAFGHHKLT